MTSITSGIVVDGKIVVEGEPLTEGMRVTVVFDDADNAEGFTLTPEQEAELQLSIDQADHGEFISAEELLAELRARK